MAKSDSTVAGSSPRTGKSKFLSIAASVGLIAVVGACCLCGGVVWQKQPSFESDRAAAVALTQEILPVTVPAVFTPEGTIQWDLWTFLKCGVPTTRSARGRGNSVFSKSTVASSTTPTFANTSRNRCRSMVPAADSTSPSKAAKRKRIDVDGESVEFHFLQAEDRTTGRGRRLVDGIVNRPHGPVMISLWVDEDNWDPQMVDEMINSIGKPPTGHPNFSSDRRSHALSSCAG